MSEEKKYIPKRRFKEFQNAGAWEQRKFSNNIVAIQTGTNLLGSLSNSGVPLLKMGNIQRGYFSLDKLEYLNINEKVEEENIAYYGDFFFNTRNTLELVGKGATWTGEGGKYAFNSNIARFTFKGIDTIFFNYLYNTQDMIKQVHARAMGTTSVAAIYPQNLNSLEYKLPSIEEQKAIGSFFIQLDNLITLHQRKLEKIKALKKAYLSELFPAEGESKPKRRFAGFTDDWEQRKLESVASFSKGNGYSKSDLRDSGTPIILYGRLYTKYETSISEVDTFVDAKNGSVYSKGGEVIVPASGETAEDIARAATVENAGVLLGGDLNIITPSSDVDSVFLALSVSYGNSQKELAKKAQGKSVVHIHNQEIKDVVISFPKQEEQMKVSEYFANLDNLITLHQRKLDKLQNIKKAYLHEMFI